MSSIKLKSHKCRERCNRVSGKGDNRKVECFICGTQYFANCFNLNLDPIKQKLFFLPNSNVQFICTSCYEPVSKLKEQEQKQKQIHSNGNRQVLPAPLDTHSPHIPLITSPPPELNGNANPTTSVTGSLDIHNNIDSHNFDSILRKLEILNEKFDRIESNNNKTSSPNNTAVDNIFKLVLKLDDKVNKLHTTDDEKNNLQKIVSLLDNNNKPQTSTGSKFQNIFGSALNHSSIDNWAMQNESVDDSSTIFAGRHSLMVKQVVNDDILEILKNSDKITWETLDYLTSEVKSQNEKLNTLLTLNGKESFSLAISPLVESVINLDDSSINHGTTQTEKKDNNYIKNVPESLEHNKNEQKMPMHNSPVCELGIGLISESVQTQQTLDSTDVFSNDLLENELNDNNRIKLNSANSKNCTDVHNLNHEFHISNFNPNTSTDDIHMYINTKFETKENSIRIIRLTKKNQDVSKLKFINFKIETCREYAELINGIDFWPDFCRIKPFIRKGVVNLLAQNSLINNHF